MGRRGKGAIKQPKPPKLPTDRPRVRIDDEALDLVKPLLPDAVAVMAELMKKREDGEKFDPHDRLRYLAAKAIIDVGVRPPAEGFDAKKKGEQDEAKPLYEVAWQAEGWRAPGG